MITNDNDNDNGDMAKHRPPLSAKVYLQLGQ